MIIKNPAFQISAVSPKQYPNDVSIMIYVFTNSVDYGSYLNAKEHINKNILEILEKEGVDLAYPTSTVLVKDGNKVKEDIKKIN